MRCILKVRALSGKDDVAKKRVLGMHGHRSIDDRNHGYFDIEYVPEDLRTLAQDLVIAGRREEIEPVRRDSGAELVSATGEDHDVVVRIVADVAERVN